MTPEDLQDLYNSIRGSRSAMPVMDAKTLLVEKDFESSYRKLREAYESYVESRHRILRQSPEKSVDEKAKDAERQIKRLARKQEKAKEIIAHFEELLPKLEKKANRAKEQREQEESRVAVEVEKSKQQETVRIEDTVSVEEYLQEEYDIVIDDSHDSAMDAEPTLAQKEPVVDRPSARATGGVTVARPGAIKEAFLDGFQESWGDDQLDVISRFYDFQPVSSIADVFNDALYYLRKGDDSLLVMTESCSKDNVQLTNVLTGDDLKPLPTPMFLELGTDRTMVLLLEKDDSVLEAPASEEQAVPEVSVPADPEVSSGESQDDDGEDSDPDRVLDMGALSQLMDSAQRSGLVPGADQIAYVRDREFRQGKYDLALQTIENLYGGFAAAAASRTARLKQQDADIAAGRIKISPKELQAKRSRDRAQDQSIERARSRFMRVLDGLRVLMKQQKIKS